MAELRLTAIPVIIVVALFISGLWAFFYFPYTAVRVAASVMMGVSAATLLVGLRAARRRRA